MPWTVTAKMDRIPVFKNTPDWHRMLGVSNFPGIGLKFDPNAYPGGYPTRVDMTNKQKLGHFMIVGGTAVVDDAVREIFETLEQGVHQFIPVDIYLKDGVKAEEPYYNLRWGQSILAILSKESGFDGNWTRDVKGRPLDGLPAHAKELFFSAPAIAGKHMWVNPSIHGPLSIIFSDELMEAFQKIGADKYLYCKQYPAINVAWNAEEEIKPLLDSWEDHWDETLPSDKETYRMYRGDDAGN